MAEYRVRPARPDDLERLVEIHACAYPDGGGYDHHERKFTHASFGDLSNFRVVESGRHLVGHAALYPQQMWMGGREVPIGGIASLGVAPEARGLGAAHALLARIHQEIASSGAALALLYPFRERFYADLGYATTAPLISLRISAATLALALAKRKERERFTLIALDGPLFEQVKALYQQVGRESSGRLLRGETRWMRIFARESRHWMGAVEGTELAGYASFSYDAAVANGRQTLLVHELVAPEESARQALLRALARQRDQIDDIELTVPFGDPLPFLLEDATGSRRGTARVAHPLGTLAAGPMVRLTDSRRTLTLRGYARDGELVLRVSDGAEAEVLRIAVRAGRAEVEPSHGSPDLELSRATLGSMLVGGVRPSEAALLGQLQGGASAVRLADELFSVPRFQCLDPF